MYSKNSLVLALEANVSLNLNAGSKLGSVSPTFASFIACFREKTSAPVPVPILVRLSTSWNLLNPYNCTGSAIFF